MTAAGTAEIFELEKLRQRRADCRLSHAEAAHLSGVSVSTIKALEGPRGHITSKTLTGLCRGYALALPGADNQFQPVLDAAVVKSVAEALAPLIEVGDTEGARALLDYRSIVNALSISEPPEDAAIEGLLRVIQSVLPPAKAGAAATELRGDAPTQDGWVILGKAVVARRIRMGYGTREKFAQAAGISSRLLSDIENGKRTSYDPATLVKLEEALKWEPGGVDATLAGGDAEVAPVKVDPARQREIVSPRPGREQYGTRYWIVDRPDGGYIGLHANRVQLDAGHLAFYGGYPEYLTFALPPGSWTAFYAAALIDGAPVAADRWIEQEAG